MKNVGHAVRAVRLPQLYQEYVGHDNNRDAYMLNMIESRVMEHTWRAVGAADHLRAPPVGAVSDAHLAAAVFRAGRHRRAVPDVARSEHDRHGDRARASTSGARSAPRTWAPASTRGIPATSTTRRCSRTSRPFWTETALYWYATPHKYTLSDFPPEHARPAAAASTPARGRPAGGGCVMRWSTWRRRRSRCSITPPAIKDTCCSIAIAQASGRSTSTEGAALCLSHPAATARSGGRGRIAAAAGVPGRSGVADVERRDRRRQELRRRHVGDPDGSGVRRDRASGAGRAAVSRPSRVARRSARAAVRRGGLDPAVSNGASR